MVRTYSPGLAPGALQNIRSLPWWTRYKPARVLFIDDFEGVLKWTVTGTLTKDGGADVFEGSYQLKATTAASVGALSGAGIRIGAVPKGQVMLQLRWHPNAANDTYLRNVDVILAWYDGPNSNTCTFRYLKNLTTPQNKWQYLDLTQTAQDLPGGGQNIDSVNTNHNFLRVKADFRQATPLYTLLESNDLKLKLPNIPGYQAASSNAPFISVTFKVVADLAFACSLCVDALILSDQES